MKLALKEYTGFKIKNKQPVFLIVRLNNGLLINNLI